MIGGDLGRWGGQWMKSDWTLIVLVFLMAVSVFSFGQRLPNNRMLGDDAIYGSITAHLHEGITQKKLDDYRIKRILPLALVHYPLRWLHVDLNKENITQAFRVWSVIFYTLVAFVWCHIARELKLSVRGKWIGVLAIFCNYHLLKHLPYVVVSTDIFAYFFTFAVLYFYLRNNAPGLLFATVLGAFSWPSLVHMATLLLLFPRDRGEREARPAPFGLNWLFPVGLSAFVAYQMHILYEAMERGAIFKMGIFSMGANHPLRDVLPLSMTLVVLWLLITLPALLNVRRFFTLDYFKRTLRWQRILAAAGLFVGIKCVVGALAGSHNARPLDYLIANLLLSATIHPLGFLVTHVSFFGPFLILAVFLWKPLLRTIQPYGLGLVLCMVIVFLFAMDSESRKQMNTYAVFIPFLIKAIDDLPLKKWQLGLMAALCLFFSRIWLIWPETTGNDIFSFPKQYFYMNIGPWASHQAYYLSLSAVLVLAFIVYKAFFAGGREE